MYAIKIYRKDAPGPKPRKLTKTQLAKLAEVLTLTSRVSRPELVELFTSGAFYAMTALPPAVIDNRAERIIHHADKGWVVPTTCLGRVADKVATGDAYAATSAAQSILLWVKKNLSDVVNPAHVSVVVELVR